MARPRKKFCKRNHDQTIPANRRRVIKKDKNGLTYGTWECRACHNERQRDARTT